MRDRTLRRLIVGLLLAAPLSSCHRLRQDEWDVPPSTSAGRAAASARLAADGARPEIDTVARGLFAKSCATCHGLDGSGQGPSVLDRPARNFKDGGFSFGNTADAIFNTISSGIPGTPMPAFAESLAESDRRRLAAYVRTLGPPVDEVDVAETILTVTDESGPRIVRGILPPIVKGAPVRARGLLVGLPGGLTFEYRIDDVRLLGVRQGGFVERTDWRDRGGTPLKPLGGLIWVDGDGDPPATFTAEQEHEWAPLRSRLDATFSAWRAIGSSLVDAAGTELALVTELFEPIAEPGLAGFRREVVVTARQAAPLRLRMRIPTPRSARLIASFESTAVPGDQREWHVWLREDGVYECIRSWGETASVAPASGQGQAQLVEQTGLAPGAPGFFAIEHVFATTWSDQVRDRLRSLR
jgi:mono/diheme cytochrome c family protein